MTPTLSVTVYDGKYTVFQYPDGTLITQRHGKDWDRDLTGDGLVLALAQEVDTLRREIAIRDSADWDDL